MPLSELKITEIQTVNACAIRSLDMLAFLHEHQTETAVRQHLDELRTLKGLAENEAKTYFEMLSQKARAAGAASGLPLNAASKLVNDRHKTLCLSTTEHTYQVKFQTPESTDKAGELRDLFNGLAATQDTEPLETFLTSYGIAFSFEDYFSPDAYLKNLCDQIKRASRNNDGTTPQQCIDWIHCQEGNYPKSFTALGNGHYCSLTVFNEAADAAIFNSNSGKLYFGKLPELFTELQRILLDFELQLMRVTPKPTLRLNPSSSSRPLPKQDLRTRGTPPNTPPSSPLNSAGSDGNATPPPASPAFFNKPVVSKPKYEALKAALTAYITRIETYRKRSGEINFEQFRFPLFRKSRGLNRELNYRLACQLFKDLNEYPTTNIDDISAITIARVRGQIRDQNFFIFDPKKGFVDRGINSSELNAALTAARVKTPAA